MTELNTRERFVRTLTGQEVDRVPFMRIFGGGNQVLPTWKEENPGVETYIDELLGFEGGYRGWRITPVNFWLCGDIRWETVEETEQYIVQRNNIGQINKALKTGDYHNHVLEYPVKTWRDWEYIKSTYLDPDDPGRIPKDWHNYVELYRNRTFPLQLTCGGVYGFARKMMGDEALCYAFYDEPELVHDMMDSYIDFCLRLWEKLCVGVSYDLIECWEDMASKQGSIISPQTFREFMAPNYRKIRAFANEHDIPIVMVDSDGNINELCGWMAESGVNAMYPFEAGAGCDPLRALNRYPGLGAVACLEKNAAALGDNAIEEQMELARALIRNGRCIPGPDHMVLENVTFEGYKKFMLRLRDVIMTTKPGQ